jgi:hypothetical protein
LELCQGPTGWWDAAPIEMQKHGSWSLRSGVSRNTWASGQGQKGNQKGKGVKPDRKELRHIIHTGTSTSAVCFSDGDMPFRMEYLTSTFLKGVNEQWHCK